MQAEPTAPVLGSYRRGETRERLRRLLETLDGFGSEAWALLGVALVVAAAVFAVRLLGWLLFPLALGLVLGVLSSPIVNWLARRNVPRRVATGMVFVAIVAIVVVVAWIAVPPFLEQASRLASRFPDFLDEVAERITDLQQRIAGNNPAAADAVADFSDELRARSIEFADGLSATFLGIAEFAFSAAAATLLGVVIAFLAVKDLPSYTSGVVEWLDRSRNYRLSGALRSMARTATGFIRGQLILAVIVGVLTGSAMALIGVPFSIPLGAVAAIGDLIPTIGPWLAAVPAIVLALSEGGVVTAVLAGVAALAIQQIEAYLLVPLIVGKAVDLSALTVIVSLTVAGGTFGIVGLLVAVPAVGMLRDAVRWYFMSDEEAFERSRLLAAEAASGRDLQRA